MRFEYNNISIDYKLIRSKRKSVSITMKYSGEIIVRCPMQMKNQSIAEYLKANANWIEKNLDKIQDMKKNFVRRTFENGSYIMFLGKEYKLNVVIDDKTANENIRFEKDNIVLTTNKDNVDRNKDILKDWYKSKCYDLLGERISYYQKFFPIKSNGFKIKEQKSIWASCTYDNRILFNWRCIMADIEAFDYVVVHEMCHFEHKNHSRDFWACVENILPDYKKRKQWLKENGIRMEF